MKFSEKKNDEKTIVQNETAASSVQTFRGNPEWDERNEPSGKVSRTGLYERSFRNKSEGFTAVFDAEASQFRDVDGTFKKIESVFVLDGAENEKHYKNKANRFSVQLPETLDSKVLSVEHGTAKVEFSLVDPTENNFNAAIKKKMKGCFKNTLGRIGALDGESILKYLAVAKDTDMEYAIDDDRVKENIILRGKRSQYKFAFVMQCENVLPQMNEGEVVFVSKEDPESDPVFRIPVPVMFDNKGEKSDKLHYEIDQISDEDDTYLFMVVADKGWINAEEREFPVTIDPQVLIEKNDKSPKLLTVDQQIGYCTCHCTNIQNTGSYTMWNNGCECSNLIVNVKNPVKHSSVFNKSVRVMRASLIWAVTDSNGCGHVSVRIGDKIIERFRYDGATKLRIDVTNQLNEMILNNKEDIQVAFEVDYEGNCEQYISMQNGKDALSLLVDYIPLDLVAQNSESVSFDVKGAGKGSVNLATRNVFFEHPDITADSATMPVSISHVYDGDRANTEYDSIQSNGSTDKITPDYHMGKGWKLNVQQTLVVPGRIVKHNQKKTDNEDQVYFIDSIGRKKEFQKKFFYLQDGVKHFIAQTQCKKEGGEFVVDDDGCYRAVIDGKTYVVYKVYMSDDSLYLYLDQGKAMYLDERVYDRYYTYKDVRHGISLGQYNSFKYNAFYFMWSENSNRRYQVDPSYVKQNADGTYSVKVELADGTVKEFEAFHEIVSKFLYKDKKGEYFEVNVPVVCCSGSAYTSLKKERIYVEAVDELTQDAYSLSTAHYSEELLNIDSYLSEINQAIVELDETHESYIDQQISLLQNKKLNDQIGKAQERLNDIQDQITQNNVHVYQRKHEIDVAAANKTIEDCNKELENLEEWNSKSWFGQTFSKDKQKFKGQETEVKDALMAEIDKAENSLEYYDAQKEQVRLEESAKRITDWVNNLKMVANQANEDKQMDTLWDLRQKNREQRRVYIDMRNKQLELRAKIIEKEKTLLFDYIYDDSGNMMMFDYYGHLIGIQDNSGNGISIEYDYDHSDSIDDKILSITTTDEQKILFSYNSLGRLESITDTSGRITKYVYDQSGNLTRIFYPEYDAEHPWSQTSFVYCDNGLACVKDQSGYYVELHYEPNSISINEYTETFRIKDGKIEYFSYGEVVDGSCTTIAFRSPFVTAVTNKNTTVVYQLDVTGKVMASYEEVEGMGSSRKTVSNATTFAYLGKKRSFSVKADPSKANLIPNGDFASLSDWNIVNGCSDSYSDYVDGNKGLVIYGNSDYDSRVYQTLNAFASGKRHYLLSLWAKATSAQIDSERCTGYEDMYLETHANTELFDGEACRKFGIKAAVTYVDGTCEDFYASFDWFNTNWQLCQLPMCLKNDPASMIVSFEYGYNVGTAIIDNFRLTEEYGSESRFSEDGKLIWSCDGNIQRFYTYNGGAYPVEVLEVDCEDARSNGCTQNCAECNGKSTCKHAVNKYGFNAKGQLLWSEDHNGIITKNTYDDKGRKIATATYHEDDPTSKFVSESVYDDKGRQTETMDPRGEVNGEKLSQKMDYEPGTNLLTSVISAGGKKTVYGYDHLTDACVSISSDDDGTEHTNRMNFTAGFLTRVDNSSGMCYNYVYDGFGKLVQVLINGDVVASYDETESADGSKISTKMLDGVTFSATSDSRGRATEVKVGNTILKNGYSYDKADRCTAYTEFPNDPSKKKEHEFKYGETQDSHSVGGVTVTNQKDEKRRAIRTTYRFGESDSLAYDFAYEDSFDGTLKSITYNNAIEQSFAHDKLGRQTESRLSNSCGSTVYAKRVGYLKHGNHTTNLIADLKHNVLGAVSHEKYSYDAEGNISAIHEDGKLKVRFTYDNLNRLIREDNKDLGLTTVFAYDNGGNLLRQREYPFTLDAVENLDETNTFVYSYGNENRPDQLTRFGSKTISYDANGCPTNYLGNDCTFEYGTRMTQFGSNTFSYDADGLRTAKNNVAYTYMDGKLIRQTGGSGQIDFIYGATGMIGFKYNEAYYFYRRNLMGDVTHIYNENGTLFAEYVYDAWGNYQIKTDVDGIGTINPIRYRGYYYDTETGLYYLRARYYDPETGRFISQDDISYLAPEHLSGLNLYAYCNDNPIMYFDPSGNSLLTIGLILALTTIVGGAIGGVVAYQDGKRGWDLVGGIAVGAVCGLAAGGAVIATFSVLTGAAAFFGTMGATGVTFLGVPVAQAFAIGALAVNVLAFVLLPLLGKEMEGVEYEEMYNPYQYNPGPYTHPGAYVK